MKSTKKLVYLAMFTAISIILVLSLRINFVPPANFLIYDPADIPIYVATVIFGGIPGLLITAAVSLIQAFTISNDGFFGAIMHFFATGSFVIVLSLIRKINDKKTTLLLAFISGIIIMTVTMVGWNLIITPIYLNVPRKVVIDLLIPGIIPFNLLKGAINGLVAFALLSSLKPILNKIKE